jgi:hypothetical protein
VAFCLISNSETWQNEVTTLIEKGINKNQITFYINNVEYVDPKAWIWYWHVSPNCDLIICDTSHCTDHELHMCLAMLKMDLPVVFQVNPGNEELATLLNSISVPHFESIEELDSLLEAAFGN